MTGQSKKPGDDLRRLARLIIDDNISASRLESYVRALLCDRLLELDWETRRFAARLIAVFDDLSPDDIAFILRRRAEQVDRHERPRSPLGPQFLK